MHLAAWAEWAITVAPPIVGAAMLIWAVHRSAREDRTGRTPDSWCARCDVPLYADHAGRYYATHDGYLCPPQLRLTGGRRHEPADATARDRQKP